MKADRGGERSLARTLQGRSRSWGRRVSPLFRSTELRESSIRNSPFRVRYEAKVVVPELPLAAGKSPGDYIKAAREKYLLRTSSIDIRNLAETVQSFATTRRTSANSSPKRLTIDSSKEVAKGSPSVLPNWLHQRRDFVETMRKMKARDAMSPAEICEREAKMRSPEEKKALKQFLKTFEFFSALPSIVLSDIADRMKTEDFEKGDFLARQGERGNCMFVVVSGKIAVLIGEKKVAEFEGNHVVGEAALQLDVPRTASIVACTAIRALRLDKFHFEGTMAVFKKQERRTAIEFLLSESVLCSFGLPKIQRLSSVLLTAKFAPNQVIYDVNDTSESFYILRQGQVCIETFVEIAEANRWPVRTHAWEVREFRRKFRVLLRKSKPGELFGLADLVREGGRRTRAVAKTTAVCYLTNMHQFCDLFTKKDLQELLRCEGLHIMETKELAEKVKEDVVQVSAKQQSILSAYNLADIPLSSREASLNPQSRKLQGWMHFMRKCLAQELTTMRRNVVAASQSTTVLDALGDFQTRRESQN